MVTKILLTFICASLSLNNVARAHHPLARELLQRGTLQKAVDLKNLKQNGNFGDIFSSKKKDVVVSDLGNKILKVAGNLPNNGTLIIQGESYMELFDPQDIRDPMLLLQKVFQANKQPVSVSLPVTEPYFIFTTPRAIDKIAGTNNIQDVKASALSEAMKLNRVKRHHPSALSSVLSRLQSFALVPITTPTGATRYLLLKEPKFIVYNNDKQQSGNSQQLVRTRPLQLPSGGSPQVPAPAPATAVNIPVPTGKKWMVAPMKSKTVAIGMMPREAGGGGLTAANRGNLAQPVTSAPNLQTVPSAVKSNNVPKATTMPESRVTLPASTATSPQGTTNELGAMVSKMAVIADGFSKPQEIIDFQNAKEDALQKLDAVIMNKAERQDVINFAKSLLNAMKLLNVVVAKHGERRDTAVFAQAMLSGLKRLDDIFKKGTKQQVVNYAKTMVDAIKLYDVEADPNSGAAKTPSPTQTTTTATTTAQPDTTTTDVPEEPPTTTEEYEMEDYTTPDYYTGATTAGPMDIPSGRLGLANKPTTLRPPPGVAGWKGGPTTEPALGPHDRLNTTDVPEEIEARPDKTPAEKRRDFLEMNPHLRGKLPPLKKDKATPGVTPAPSNASAQSQTNNSQPKAVNTRKNVVQKKKPRTKKKTVLESLILRRKNKKRTGKHKISARRKLRKKPWRRLDMHAIE